MSQAIAIDARKQWDGATAFRRGAVLAREGNVAHVGFRDAASEREAREGRHAKKVLAPFMAAAAALAAGAGMQEGAVVGRDRDELFVRRGDGASVGRDRDGSCYTGTDEDDCTDPNMAAALMKWRSGVSPQVQVDAATQELVRALHRARLSPGYGVPSEQEGPMAFDEISSNTANAGTTISEGIVTLAGGDSAILRVKPNFGFKPKRLMLSVFVGENNLLAWGFFKIGGIDLWPNAALMTGDYASTSNMYCPIPLDHGAVSPQVPIQFTVKNLVPNQAIQFSAQMMGTYYRGQQCG